MAALALAKLQVALQTAGGTGGGAEKHPDGEATGRHGYEPALKHHSEQGSITTWTLDILLQQSSDLGFHSVARRQCMEGGRYEYPLIKIQYIKVHWAFAFCNVNVYYET